MGNPNLSFSAIRGSLINQTPRLREEMQPVRQLLSSTRALGGGGRVPGPMSNRAFMIDIWFRHKHY